MVGDDCECVANGDEDAGDKDGFRQVSMRIFELFDHEVQVIPPIICEQCRVEGECDLGEVGLGVLEREMLRIALG